jgi:hypothetical protein
VSGFRTSQELIGFVRGCAILAGRMGFKLDYDKMFLLDAENLAEGGILRAYQPVQNVLAQYGVEPAQVEEFVDNDKPSYSVRCGDQEYLVYSPALPDDEGQSWGRAAHTFFKIINDQLSKSEYRLYAINGGNDMGGMFLTRAECEAAQKSLPHKQDWPYLPTRDHPWYGQHHD